MLITHIQQMLNVFVLLVFCILKVAIEHWVEYTKTFQESIATIASSTTSWQLEPQVSLTLASLDTSRIIENCRFNFAREIFILSWS